MLFPPGTRLGHYELKEPLGSGGMGEVYLATDTALGRTVALKVFCPSGPDGPQRLRRFVQEARAASQINHQNITHIYEVVEDPELCYIAMEFVDGQTLHRRLTQGPLEIGEVLEVAVQVASALEAAHECDIVHRDIKSENIMLGRQRFVKLLDFGLAKMVSTGNAEAEPGATTVSRSLTNPGVIMGTVSYMSPEQARGQAVDARTDIWSFGVVLYEMVAGRPPFAASTSGDMIASILYREPPALARFSPDTPEELEWVIRKALTKDREERYQTAREMLADLEKIRRQLETVSAEQLSRPPREPLRTDANGGGTGITDAASSVPTNDNGTSPQTAGRHALGVAPRGLRPALILSLTALLAASGILAVFYASRRERPLRPQHTLLRLAFDSDLRQGRATLQNGSTWSPDGNFVAYASNRGDAEDFNIWVQLADGGNPARVTDSTYHDWQPDWSPDGKLIAFRSERAEASGIFLVPALGGMERRLTNFGYRPRWSSDGSRILFLDWGDRVFEFPRLFVKELGDAPATEVPTDTGGEPGVKQGAAGWHPDGLRVSYLDVKGKFWTVPVSGGAPPLKSEISKQVAENMRAASVDFVDFVWATAGDALYLAGRARGVTDIWRVEVEPASLRWVGGPERLTTGLGRVSDLAISKDGKRLAFSTLQQELGIWLFPFDERQRKPKADQPPAQVSDRELLTLFCDLTRDGQRLVFAARRPGLDRQELWLKLLSNGHETLLQSDGDVRFFPRWSPDGRQLAYSRFKIVDPQTGARAGPVVLWDVGGEERLVTSPGTSSDYVYDWSPDGRWLLASTNRRAHDRWEVCMFPVAAAPRAEEAMKVVASDERRSLWAPRFSPDGRWVVYASQEASGAKDSILYVVPAGGGQPVALTAAGTWCDWPRWSQDGKTVYFVSNFRTSFFSVWGVNVDAETGGSVGAPFRVTNFGNPARMISPRLAVSEMTVSRDHLALPVMEVRGNIWVLGNLAR